MLAAHHASDSQAPRSRQCKKSSLNMYPYPVSLSLHLTAWPAPPDQASSHARLRADRRGGPRTVRAPSPEP